MIPRLAALLSALAGAAAADAPRVAADVAPVHSLVARVMDGVGEPALILPPGASPHDHAMRPSEASALQDAQAVFWVGPALTPWLDDAIATLAPDAAAVPLLEAAGTSALPFREGAVFGEDGHGEEGHDHGGVDPHAWLDPENAKAWLDAIAAELSRLDPADAAAFRANAAAGRAEIDAAAADVEAALAPVRDARFVVLHDAFGHFERRFGIAALGAVSDADAAPPSPARLSAIREAAARVGATCVLAEPGSDPGLLAAVAEASGARTAVADPLGGAIEPGPALYPQLLRDLGQAMAGCL